MAISSRFFQRAVFAAMMIGFLTLLAAGAAAVLSVVRNQRHSAWVEHSYAVENALNHYGLLSERLETARRGYILQPTGGTLATYAAMMKALPQAVDRVAALTGDNPVQQARIPRLRAVTEAHRASAARSIALMQDPNLAMRAMAEFGVDTSLHRMRAIRALVGEMVATEDALLVARNAEQVRSERRLYAVLGITGILLVLVAGSSIWVIQRYTGDLNRSQAELRLLNEDLEGAVAARTVDLTRANEEIQRFAYIVSHDLRSPLVNVMGFTAELEATIVPLGRLIDRVEAAAPALLDDDARLAAREDLPEAIGFIRSSTGKMDRLINAILRLSREGRRTLTPVPIDLGELAAGVRDALQHRLTELGAEVDIVRPLPALTSDRLALEQILSNLVENAVKYLQPGRPGRIAVLGTGVGDRVVIEVADNGRGIDPRDHDRIFDLFRRSGVQDQPGEGLGLAHVRALSYRLGGVIGCASRLGEGSTFRLSLPAELVIDKRERGIAP